MILKRVTNIDDENLKVYTSLTEAQLRNKLNESEGVFIAESPKVIAVALDKGYVPLSMLCEERHIEGDAAPLLLRCPADMPVYTGDRKLLASLTGYTLTRGVLCAMRRPAAPSLEEVLANARRVVVLDGVVDSTNVGAIFRSAAALGIDAVLVAGATCDPYNRRAVRVSMGSVFLVPWTHLGGGVEAYEKLRAQGFKTAAMALRKNSINIDSPLLEECPRLALVMGAEGDGLDSQVIDNADFVVCIPMHHCVDSLNVAAASAVAFWQLRAPDLRTQ